MTDTPVYLPRTTYRLFAVGGAAVALLFLREILNGFSLPSLFFLLGAIAFALIHVRWALMRLELTADGVTVRAPLQAPLLIQFRQMITCEEAGRFVPGVSLVYRPISADGIVDTDVPRTLFLPAVARQDEFLAALQERIPE
ncbi:MAG: hypothetical protein F4148_14515 [Caldilineaceae bacterium SB0675_bin_29]|uniref:PH domain-containing protein n=1 Tax=Caldilineaceae bacterium SB0675_bin_29 TaxID=2605266 RepID=A0A6B1G6B8_9CHLR|nr:hypothetical protein [Caldilineaceae bacterium SB0675_bin_29]